MKKKIKVLDNYKVTVLFKLDSKFLDMQYLWNSKADLILQVTNTN